MDVYSGSKECRVSGGGQSSLILNLPLELHILILESANVSTLTRCACVSRLWFKHASARLWSGRLVDTPTINFLVTIRIERLAYYLRLVQRLVLAVSVSVRRENDLDNTRPLSGTNVESALKLLSSGVLRNVRATYINEALTSLAEEDSAAAWVPGALLDQMLHEELICLTIQSPMITDSMLRSVRTKCPQILRFYCGTGAPNTSKEEWIDFIRAMPQLELLFVRDRSFQLTSEQNNWVSENSSEILQCMLRLPELRLFGCPWEIPATLCSQAHDGANHGIFGKLEVLLMTKVPSQGFQNILMSCKHLRVFRGHFVDPLTIVDKTFWEALSKVQTLSEIEIRLHDTDRLTFASLVLLAQSCPLLERIDLHALKNPNNHVISVNPMELASVSTFLRSLKRVECNLPWRISGDPYSHEWRISYDTPEWNDNFMTYLEATVPCLHTFTVKNQQPDVAVGSILQRIRTFCEQRYPPDSPVFCEIPWSKVPKHDSEMFARRIFTKNKGKVLSLTRPGEATFDDTQ